MEVKILRLVVTHSCSHGYYLPLKFEFHYCEIPLQGDSFHFLNTIWKFVLRSFSTSNIRHESPLLSNYNRVEFSRSNLSRSTKLFFFQQKFEFEKKKFSGRCIYNTTVTQIFVHLYYLRRDDFTKLNFCRPTVNNDNSRPSLSAPAEARQRLQVVVVLARDIVLPRQETRSEAANAPASDTGFIREICAEGVPLPPLFSLSRIMQRKMNRKRRSIPLFPS